MGKNKPGKSSPKSAFAYVSIGMQLAATILICVIGGYKLDQYYKMTPVFLISGTFLGMVIGFYSLFKELISEKRDNNSGEDPEKDRYKWM
jgi:F0F1-type ATP synthase assembly protein I